MARERYGLEINPGPFGINSRPALVGAKFAAAQNAGAAYHDAVFKAYWRDGRDIGEPDVLVEIASQLDLSGPAFHTALSNPFYDQAVTTEIDQARQYGLSGVPAAVFSGKYLISGAQPLELFLEVADKALQEG